MKRRIGSWTVALLALSIAVLPCLAADKPGITIEIQSVNKLIADVNCVAAGAGFPSQSSNLVSGLSKLINTPKLAGIDTNSPVRIYVYLPAPSPESQDDLLPAAPSAVIVIGLVGNPKAFLDTYAKSFASSEQLKDMQRFSGATGTKTALAKDSFVKLIGRQAVIGQRQDHVRMIAGMMAKGPITDAALLSVKGAVRLSIDIASCVPSVDKAADTLTHGMDAMPMPPAGPAGADPRKIARAEVVMLTNMVRQVRTFAMGIGADAKNVEITTYVSAVPGTTFERMMKKLQPVSDRYSSLLPDNSLAYLAGNGAQLSDDLIAEYADFLGEIGAAMAPNVTNAAALMKKSLLGLKGACAGDSTAVVIAKPDGKGITAAKVTALKDPAIMEKYMIGMVKDYNETYGKLSPGITISGKGERKYQNKTIHAYGYSVDKSAPGFMPNPFASLFTTQTNEWTIVGNDLIATMGSEAQMNSTIDAVSKGGAGTSKSILFRHLFPQLAAKPVAVYSISLMSTIKAFLAVGADTDPQTLAMIPESKGGLAGYGYKNGDDLIGVMRINISEIAAIKDGAPMLGMLMMKSMMGSGAGKRPAANNASFDPKLECMNNLRRIDAAKEQYALAKNLNDGQTVGELELGKYFPGQKMPKCPAGGKYTINPIGNMPECSIPGHALTE